MNDLVFHTGQLVIANRVLANKGVVDEHGHVSMRHPHDSEGYFLACSSSLELVGRINGMECTRDESPVSHGSRALLCLREANALLEALA
jgi:hypothetical protein